LRSLQLDKTGYFQIARRAWPSICGRAARPIGFHLASGKSVDGEIAVVDFLGAKLLDRSEKKSKKKNSGTAHKSFNGFLKTIPDVETN
jgi:hypothetical protein